MVLRAILYNIRSAYNVGSIFRTACSLNFEKLYLFGITPTPENRKVKKTSLGSENYLKWQKVKRIKKLIKELKKEGFLVVSLEQTKKSIMLQDFEPKKEKICFIVGNEVKGINKNILKMSDFVVEIPIFGQKESLNVSIAFAVASYYLALKHRLKSKKLN